MPDTDARAARTYDVMAEAYDATVVEGDRPYNSLYERPALISMLPDFAGKQTPGASFPVADPVGTEITNAA